MEVQEIIDGLKQLVTDNINDVPVEAMIQASRLVEAYLLQYAEGKQAVEVGELFGKLLGIYQERNQ